MKLDLEKIKELEKKYQNNRIVLDTLVNLLNIVENYDTAGLPDPRYVLAYTTLKELEILKDK